jgi:hypothetical protein
MRGLCRCRNGGGQRVICDRMGICRQWTHPESGRMETETYYDAENGSEVGFNGFPQRGGIYTVAGIKPAKITLKEIPYLYWEDSREPEPQWWEQHLFRPFNNSSQRDLKWFEMLDRIREMNHNIELTAASIPTVVGPLILRAGYEAKIYVATFQNFLDVSWGTSEDEHLGRWTAPDVFDAVNVVICQHEYDYHASEWEQRAREFGGSPPDDNPPGGSPPNDGPPSDRKTPPAAVVQLRPRALISGKPSTPSESGLLPGLRPAT